MIYDTFLFRNELDMLECRLRELEDIPLKHVLVEAPVDHQGKSKPFHYAENRERFSAWEKKITHIMLTDDDMNTPPLSGDGDYFRHHRLAVTQRRLLSRGIKDADPDDLVFLSDVDEIPRAKIVTDIDEGIIANKDMPSNIALEMSLHNFAVNWTHPLPWYGTVTSRARDITDFDMLRNMRTFFPRLGGAGWHFSWLGGPEAIREKALATSHTETTDKMLEWVSKGLLYEQGFSWEDGKPFGLTTKMRPTGTDDLPLWIRERKCPEEWFRPESKLVFRKRGV